jgi:predicted MFS family arabinose efflux permease
MSIKMSRIDKVALTCLFFMTTLLYADQMIMSAILPELSQEFGVTETTLGLIGSAFILIGAIVSIVFGYFTDKTSRKGLLVLLILIGEIPCILTGIPFFTQNIEWFAVLRILSGIGLGGIYPITFSLLADYFKENNRAAASAWMTVAWAVGAILGVTVAGYMTSSFGWRFSFLLIGIPNIPVVLFFWLYAREPERGRTEDALEDLIQQGLVYRQTIKLSDFKIILKNKTNIFTFLQGIPGTVPWGILTYWMITFFQVHRGLSKELATTIFLIMGVGNTIGAVLFAYLGEVLYKRNPKFMPLICGLGILVGIIPAYILLNTPLGTSANDQIFFYSLAAFTGFIVSAPSANVKAIIMNVNRPEHRGTVFSLFNITDNLGMGMGPAVGGLLVPFGYVFMMNFAVSWWIPCGIFFLMVMLFITKDRDALRAVLSDRAKEMKKEQEAR